MNKPKSDVAALDVVKPLQESFVAAVESAMAAQEQGLKYVQTLYEAGLETTKHQAESASRMAEILAQQAQRQGEAFEGLAQKSIQMYMDSLKTALSTFEKQA